MKFFTNRSVVQKIVIAILTILVLTFAIPKPVSAVTNILLSPIITLATSLLDGIQHILEWAMLGETSSFMKDIGDTSSYPAASDGGFTVNGGNAYAEDEIDGTLWGADAVNIPNIRYTPEEIFANRVPALDINFINPSVKTGNDEWDQEHNIAMRLQPVISSWYVAIRTLALVALLSVLVYLGIRMLITSVAADKAKYKKMMMDWIVGICLLFALHYIMSFALTMSEVLTSMLGQDTTQAINVKFINNGEKSFSGNLMSYVRFMIQSTDTWTGVGFFFLYLMLVIYSIRFTWVYLKRVVNMAFLTLIAPFVALTYPIDKVSDGSAQAFNMWIKEFGYNAVLQPLHLLLYKVLLGSSVALAAINPLYAIVCLGFILTAEKLLKQMFGFNKAGAGTVGSLAGAAGVTALASKALMSFGKKPPLPGGGASGKVRTNEKYKREGKNPNAPKGIDTLRNGGMTGLPTAQSDTGTGGSNTNSPDKQGQSNRGEQQPKQDTLDDLEQQRAELYNQGYTDNSEEVAAINQRIQDGDFAEPQEEPDTSGSPNPEMTETGLQNIRMHNNDEVEGPETWKSLREKDREAKAHNRSQRALSAYEMSRLVGTAEGRKELGAKIGEGKRKLGVEAYKKIRGIKAAAPAAIYKGVRGGAKLAARGLAGAALGATAGVIAATNGNGEQAMAALGTGLGVGFASGDNIFEATAGKVAKDVDVKQTYGAGQYGSKQDYRNAMADKEFLKSQEFNDYYEKNFKGKKTKKEVREAFKSYREAGITDNKTIKTAMALEDKYKKAKGYNGDDRRLRQDVQAIVQTKDGINRSAFSDPEKKAKQIKELERFFPGANAKERKESAAKLFQGYQDFDDLWNF